MSKKRTEAVRAYAGEGTVAVANGTPTKPLLETIHSTVTPGMKTMINSTKDIVALNKGNLEAFAKSGQIWAAGVQDLTKQAAATARASFEEFVATFKVLGTVTSVKDAIELQSNLARTTIGKAVAETTRITDASIKLSEQALAPITARVTVAVETFGKAA